MAATRFQVGPAAGQRAVTHRLQHHRVHAASECHARSMNVTFIEPDMWPPNSPDLNPVDYAIWMAVQERLYHCRKFENVEQLK